MRNVTVKTILFGAVVGLMLTACGKKKENPLVEPTATTYTRLFSANVEYGSVELAIQTNHGSFVKGCIQVIDYKNNQSGKVEFQQLEFSSSVCPSGNGVAEAVSIRAKFHVKTTNGVTEFYVDEDKKFGAFSEQTDPFSATKWNELSDLCSGNYNFCTVNIENTRLKSIE